MTGYEKSPDYGSAFTWRTRLGVAVFFTTIILVPIYLVFG